MSRQREERRTYIGCYSETTFTAASRAVQFTLAAVCKITQVKIAFRLDLDGQSPLRESRRKLGPFRHKSSVGGASTVPVLSTQSAKYSPSAWMSTPSTRLIKYPSDVTCVASGGLRYPTLHFISAIIDLLLNPTDCFAPFFLAMPKIPFGSTCSCWRLLCRLKCSLTCLFLFPQRLGNRNL